jgi:hypothetical protein
VKWEKLFSVLLASLLVLCIQNTYGEISKEDYCDKLWRYDIECAIDYMLSPDELQEISSIAEKLKGSNCKQTAWNVLEWVDKNIKYDYEKSSLPPPEVKISPAGVEVYNQERYIQTPSETALRGKGICTDYTFLIAALLLYNGCDPYVVNMTFEGGAEGHVSAAIEINGTYYFLDQHLPPLDPGSYYGKWLRDGRKIAEAVVYSLKGEDKMDFSVDFQITEKDLAKLEEGMNKIIGDEYGLRRDLRLREKLPVGYSEGKILTLIMENMADYYTPEFRREIAGYIVDKLANEDSLESYRSFKLDVDVSGNNLAVKLYLAR